MFEEPELLNTGDVNNVIAYIERDNITGFTKDIEAVENGDKVEIGVVVKYKCKEW